MCECECETIVCDACKDAAAEAALRELTDEHKSEIRRRYYAVTDNLPGLVELLDSDSMRREWARAACALDYINNMIVARVL